MKKILSVLAVAVVAFLVVVANQPDEFRVTRSITVDAPAEKVFAYLNDLKKWKEWSPWEKMDPNATETHEGAETGVGAIMRWSGNMEVGEGSMKITESRTPEYLKLDLDFVKPMKSSAVSEFELKPDEGGTSISWTMYGKNDLIAKAVHLVMNCEKMVGEQFDIGLASLKAITEK